MFFVWILVFLNGLCYYLLGKVESGKKNVEGEVVLKIKDFCDMQEFEAIMRNWAKSTGLATVAVGADGKYISWRFPIGKLC